MTFPNLPPGVIYPPINALEQRVAALEARLDAVGRRDLTNAVVGQGGTFRATLEAGGVDVLSIAPGSPTYGSKQQMRMADGQGHTTYRTDELAGYGLSAPLYHYTLATGFNGSGSATNTAGVEAVMADSLAQFYNPAIFARALITVPNAASGSARFVVTDGGTTVSSSSTSWTGGVGNIQKCLLLPSGFVSNQSTTLQLLVTPGTTGTTNVYPGVCSGVSKSFYDTNTYLH